MDESQNNQKINSFKDDRVLLFIYLRFLTVFTYTPPPKKKENQSKKKKSKPTKMNKRIEKLILAITYQKSRINR